MPRAKRNAATISHTVAFENPDNASLTGTSPSRIDAVIANSATAPAASGRVINATTVAANSASNPQLRGATPACGTSQTSPPHSSGTSHRQNSDDRIAPACAADTAL